MEIVYFCIYYLKFSFKLLPFRGFLLHSSLDIKGCDKAMISIELALKMTSRNCAPSPTLVNQSISLSTSISVGRFTSS